MTRDTGTTEAFGLEFNDLPDGWTPLSGSIIVKCLDEDGHVNWAFRTTDDMSDEEMLGALVVRTQYLTKMLVQEFEDGTDDE